MSSIPTPDECPLGAAEQIRNVWLVGINTALCYLASPVLYVGVVHAPLCKELGATDTSANLPSTAYMVMSVLPLFVGWYLPYVSMLKGVLVSCYASLAAISAVVVAVLLLPVSNSVKVAVLIAHGGVVGGARTLAVAFEFEVLGRAVSESRRGKALGLAYGVGPILAIVGALASQLILTGQLGPLAIPRLESPANFAVLFGVGVPIMILGAVLAGKFVIPLPEQEVTRQPFLTGVFGGLGSFLGQSVVRRAVLIAIVVLSGYQIVSNMSLYMQDILGKVPAEFAGYQNTVRFSFKAVAGLALGWLLTRTNPKAGLLVTAAAGLAGVTLAMTVTKDMAAAKGMFLVSFGLLGAGELFGIYITNYILCCSPQAMMRRYMAFTMLTLLAAAPAGAIFGGISDYFGATYDRGTGFRLSFAVAAAAIGLAIVLAGLLLPARPRPQ